MADLYKLSVSQKDHIGMMPKMLQSPYKLTEYDY